MILKKIIVFVASAFVPVILGVTLSRTGRALDPWQLFSFGLIGLVLLNMLVFTHNLFKAFASVRRKSEKEFEDNVVPALRGHLTQLKGDSVRIYGWIMLLCLGEIVGAVVLLVLRHYRGGF